MLFSLKAVPRVDVNDGSNEFFLSITKEELLAQYKKDCEQFCITASYALTMLCSPCGFSHNLDDAAVLDLISYVQSDEEVSGLAFVVEYKDGQPQLTIGLEY